MQSPNAFEDDINKAYSDIHAKEGVTSRAKSIELKFDDFKEVNYLQDLLVDKDANGPEVTIEDFKFDDAEYPMMKIGDRPYEAYNPPLPTLNEAMISRFSAYFDLFAPPKESSGVEAADHPKWTLEGALQYMRAHDPSAPTPGSEITTQLEVLSSGDPQQPFPSIDADIVSLEISDESASAAFLQENAKTYKTSGTGIPNALAVTPSAIIVGMSKSQVLFFARRDGEDSPAGFLSTPLSPAESPSPSPSAPAAYGSAENAADLGSVLSLGTDAAGTVCAVGYSSGAIDLLSVERRALLRSFASLHATAVVFVRVLSNEAVLSADYDGNVNVTPFARKLFASAGSSARVLSAAQFGQVFDVSVLPFVVRREEAVAADLIAITHRAATLILLADQGETRVLFSLPRGEAEVSSAAAHFEAKSNYVQSGVSTAWRRGERNSFHFLRCDTDRVDLWTISVRAGVSLHGRRGWRRAARWATRWRRRRASAWARW